MHFWLYVCWNILHKYAIIADYIYRTPTAKEKKTVERKKKWLSGEMIEATS